MCHSNVCKGCEQYRYSTVLVPLTIGEHVTVNPLLVNALGPFVN
jgi:hypothetical protein